MLLSYAENSIQTLKFWLQPADGDRYRKTAFDDQLAMTIR